MDLFLTPFHCAAGGTWPPLTCFQLQGALTYPGAAMSALKGFSPCSCFKLSTEGQSVSFSLMILQVTIASQLVTLTR